MREPYATLMDPYRDHWLLAPYLQDDVPDFAGIAAATEICRLSSGELLICQIGLAIWSGDRTAAIADLGDLDTNTRLRVLRALELTCVP